MIRLSKLSDYAVVVLSQLARGERPLVTAAELADATGVPEPTVAKVLKLLVRGNIIVSVRGAAGGYQMERLPQDISIRELIIALEGPIAVTACLDTNHTDCQIADVCSMKGRWHKVNSAIIATLEAMPLSDLLESRPLLAQKGRAAALEAKNA
jgi:FeS assembly SUF system regulator